MGYYALNKKFVHDNITMKKDNKNKNYPKYDEYLSKSFSNENECLDPFLYRKVADTFKIFENFHSKMNEVQDIDKSLWDLQNKPIAREIPDGCSSTIKTVIVFVFFNKN